MPDPYYNDAAALAAILFILIPLFLILALAGYLISSFFLMKIFDKAGVQGRWRAWVPVYNLLVLGKLGDLSPWVVLIAVVAGGVLSQVPVIGWLLSLAVIAVSVMYSWRVGLKLGKEWYYLLLWLIPGVGTLIWLGILAFGSARWNDRIAPSPWANSFLADKTVWGGIPVQASAAPAGAGYAPPGSYPPPSPGAQAPAPGYQAPPPGYQAPPPGYSAPPPAGATPSAAPPTTPPAVPPTSEPPVSPDQPRP